ncbi:lipid II flippase MurJ [Cellulomonas sp. ICMP 17802]|uniref:lipid II flippase MurJ n=1 Tax=Cellulomonas sp. ICMP 17802 TaxID=3239199 RepID=UPI00351B0BA0
MKRGFLVLFAGGIFGKIVALLREIVFAAAFGTGATATGFRVAQTASIVPANLVSGDLISAAFAPSYAKLSASDARRANSLLVAYLLWVTSVLGLVSLVVFVTRADLVAIIVPGALPTVQATASSLLAVLAWVIPVYGISTITSYALSATGAFAQNAIRPMVQSVGLLVGTVMAVWLGSMSWLAWGFLAAWVLYAARGLFLLRGRLAFTGGPAVREGGLMVLQGIRGIAPLIVLAVALQGSIVLERVFASYGADGLVASIDYARTISDSVMSTIALPLGILGLTQLPQVRTSESQRILTRMTEFVCVTVIPISMVLMLAARPAVDLLYARGRFDVQAASLTSAVLAGLSAGLTFQVLSYTMARAITGRGNTRPVLTWSLVAIVAQCLVQGIGVPLVGGVAVGVGVSVYGAVLTFGLSRALGLGRATLAVLVRWLPTMVAGFASVAAGLSWGAGASVVLLVFAINVASSRATRKLIRESLVSLRTGWRARRLATSSETDPKVPAIDRPAKDAGKS